MVRMPISRRGPMACFIAPCRAGAKRKPMPSWSMQVSTLAGVMSRLTPRASRTSALPQSDETLRLPCLATRTPQAATTRATVVEMLKLLVPLPPVPQVSRIVSRSMLMSSRSISTTWRPTRIGVARARITRAAPVISATVSPFRRMAVMKAPICAGVASPPMTWSMTSIISVSVRSWRSTTLAMACLIIRDSCRGRPCVCPCPGLVSAAMDEHKVRPYDWFRSHRENSSAAASLPRSGLTRGGTAPPTGAGSCAPSP